MKVLIFGPAYGFCFAPFKSGLRIVVGANRHDLSGNDVDVSQERYDPFLDKIDARPKSPF
jgi:hypothetical protein